MNQLDPKALLDVISGMRKDILTLLKTLVEIESPSLESVLQQKIKKVIDHELKHIDYETRWFSGSKHGGNIYARPRDRLKHVSSQLLIGHFDTVWPLGTIKNMPFSINGNVVKGPGVFDMKGGIVQLIFALTSLKELGCEPSVTPLIYLNSDEEIGSHESTRDICRLAKMVDRAYVLEPALGEDGALKTRRKGVGRFSVRIKGKAAHAGLDPQAGASAILELANVIQKLFALNDLERGISVNVGVIDGGIRPNVVAPVSTASVDVRILHNADIQIIEKVIHSIHSETKGVVVEIDGKIGRPPLERNQRNNSLWQYAENCAKKLNIKITQGTAGGGSDGSTTSRFTATLDGLGAVGDGAHADHEFLYIDKLIERIALLAMLIMAPSIKEDSL